MTAPQLQSDDLYARLGALRAASSDEIKRAYQALLRQYPPERAPEEFKRIREAYETLVDPRARREYDQSLARGGDQVLAQVSAAMRRQDYATAESLLKRTLLEHPELSSARNLLGLCFLYQRKADDAINQYTRLLREPDAAPAWWGNAGHAYRIAKRYGDAERAFGEAVRRAGDDAAEYYVSWASMYMEQHKLTEARELLVKALRADGGVDFDDAPLLLKLLEVDLIERRDVSARSTLFHIERLATDDTKRRYLAWKLGVLAWQLIEAEAFTRAATVAATAKRLQPDDVDYDGLEEVALALGTFDHGRALRAVRSHVSFAAGGWLNALGPIVVRYCAEHAAYDGMKPIEGAPGLRTINGIGTSLYGRRDADPKTNSYVATLYFVFFFLPIVPLACYRVRDGAAGGWHFLGRVKFGRAQWVHLVVAVIAALVWAAASSSSGSDGEALYSLSSPPSADRAPSWDYRPADAPRRTTYRGTVTNDGVRDSPGSLLLSFDSVAHFTTGRLYIGAPLGGSGRFQALTTADSLYAASSNLDGDSILWLARRVGTVYVGRYHIVGGQYKGQGGRWSVEHATGASLQAAR